ncbi:MULTISPECIES: MBL fold metallo-hydrolase [Hyphomonas]|uniref:MBL fold metallo-hydrolase n=1 Tax=Hyphomonas adhaerens TaxID=81029 RepID=A0A3B9H2K6_9PROT|nr:MULTISPECIES: MBL fold metallo-hydrolase [Hyphomonas]MBB41506.1 MBL fold metallo-hydrolase [Hyphomonas sp.]HAE28935.1 MBL fold metallo-hydrolase [Hyphomonas adhaerens]|tara:strand:+ start:8691 stop:9641 length:951 start_codon:yes stop_codon:yes gene_type:complete
MIRLAASIFSALLLGNISACQMPGAPADAPPSTLFAQPWNSGVDPDEPAFQVQAIDADTYVIRQSLRTSFEAPFLYLLFGEDSALLIDTGTEEGNLRPVVDRLIAQHLADSGRSSLPLVVMHTHGHGDHVGGDDGFAGRPDTVVVGHSVEDVTAFFGISDWPEDIGALDLGERTVEILPTPGHHPSHVMVYDPATHILFSGDAIYPGRLFFECGAAGEYAASIDRVARFAESHQVDWLLGGHVEMKAQPGQAFGQQAKSRRGEHVLELPASAISDVQAAFSGIDDYPRVTPFAEFVLLPHPADPRGKSPPDWCKPS